MADQPRQSLRLQGQAPEFRLIPGTNQTELNTDDYQIEHVEESGTSTNASIADDSHVSQSESSSSDKQTVVESPKSKRRSSKASSVRSKGSSVARRLADAQRKAEEEKEDLELKWLQIEKAKEMELALAAKEKEIGQKRIERRLAAEKAIIEEEENEDLDEEDSASSDRLDDFRSASIHSWAVSSIGAPKIKVPSPEPLRKIVPVVTQSKPMPPLIPAPHLQRERVEERHSAPVDSPADTSMKETLEDIMKRTLIDTFRAIGSSTAAGTQASRPNPGEEEKKRQSDLAFNRKTLLKDLTTFDGRHEEWLTFISEYKEMTRLCELSDLQNIQRLRKALRGKARETVESLLPSPENVSIIISTLEKSFGRPEHIVNILIEKTKKIAPPKEENFESVIAFATAVNSLTSTIKALKEDNHLGNPQLLKDLCNKLPTSMKVNWCDYVSSKALKPSLVNFADWLSTKADALAILCQPTMSKDVGLAQKKSDKFERKKTVMTTVAEGEAEQMKCLYCERLGHTLENCRTFQKIDVDSRWKWATEKKICFSCLNLGHQFKMCRKKKECGKDGCKYSHHKLLHQKRKETPQQKSEKKPETTSKPPAEEKDKVQMSHMLKSDSAILLEMVPVILQGPSGTVKTYALLDNASQVTMVDSSLIEKLGLTGPTQKLCLHSSGDMTETEESKLVSLKIKGMKTKKFYTLKGVRSRRNLYPSSQSFDIETIPENLRNILKQQHINLEEMKYAKPLILVGKDNAKLIATQELIEGDGQDIILQKTKLGWLVSGRISAQPKHNLKNHMSFLNVTSGLSGDMNLNELVKNYFKIEDLGVKVVDNLASDQEKRAIEVMESTTRRIGNGWETGLLWKEDDISLPSSKNVALKRLWSTEKKMDKDSEYSRLYQEKIQDYLNKGFARYLTREEAETVDNKTWYLPHFGVVNPNKPGKIRIVFDAAAKVNNVSLNDALLTGPDLLTSLPGCLLKFRQREIGISGDIKDFYPSIKIRKEDENSQRFLWRGTDRKRDPDTLVMQVNMFGAVCAPFTSQAVKNKNAKEFEKDFPAAAEAIVKRHYMDDYLDSCHSVEESIQLIEDVIKVHNFGGLKIEKFASSSKEVLKHIPKELQSNEEVNMDLGDELKTERVLGLTWNPETDKLSFVLKFHKVDKDIIDGEQRPTKRDLLKVVMSIFDPLGLLGHLTIHGKILLQDIWRSELGWDVELTDDLYKKWQRFLDYLANVSSWQVPRAYCSRMVERTSTQLHVFCDASETAYAAVAYLRVQLEDGIVETSLIMSKTRVAPLRPATIPRLELQAALLGTRLATFLKKEIEIGIDTTTYWTDSKTVILWLRSETRKFKTFVAHRVGEILESTEVSEWRWISTKENVADEATRDSTAPDLSTDSRWVSGPNFLKLPEIDWPSETFEKIEETDENLEIRKNFLSCASSCSCAVSGAAARLGSPPTNAQVKDSTTVFPDPEKYNFNRMRRITAWVFRFVNSYKNKLRTNEVHRSEVLNVEELRQAEKFLITTSQQQSYGSEIKNLMEKKSLHHGSSIFKLSPYLDEDGILRIKGRIGAAPGINHETRFPAILHPKNPITKRLIEYYHQKADHHGFERVINNIRQKFWIPKIRSAVKHAWANCQHCKNKKSKPSMPEMGSLPPVRLMSRVRPFTYTGVDYFGPMEVTIGRRHEKRYGALFTCLTTRAVHLEIAHSLTTDSAIMALQRFINRRGKPLKIYSDNGTNFVGADAEMKKMIKELDHNRIQTELAQDGIDWCFIPPAAPHMGGSWERLVKSVKTALKATLKDTAPKEETLQTLFTSAEMTVNSRPLTYVSGDPDSTTSLTPNDFLLLGPSENSAIGTIDENEKCLRVQWKLAQQMADNFWRRWIKEYLPTLTRRTKWHQLATPVKVGDIVIIVDDQLNRDDWPRGRVTATYPGKDGQVRVVEVKTPKNTYRRPVSKICVLDVEKEVGVEAEVPTPGGRMCSPETNSEENIVMMHCYEF